MELGGPKDRTACNSDNVAGATVDADGVIVVLMTIESCKVHIRIGINVDGIHRLDDHPFFLAVDEIAADSFKCNLVQVLGIEHEAGNLADAVGKVRSGVSQKVQQHSHNTGIVEGILLGLTIFIID